MEDSSALDALKTDDALERKMTGRQLLWLALMTVVAPVAILIGVGSAL